MITDPSAGFATLFPVEPFTFRHSLASDPRFALQALADLATRLDRDRLEYASSKLAPNQDPKQIPGIDLAPDEVVRQIETAGAWMVLKNVESEPEYRALITGFLDQAARSAGYQDHADAGMVDLQGFLFVASPGSVTPFHSDYEQNLFVHINGPKKMHIFDNRDRKFVSEQGLETYPGKHRNLPYQPCFFADAMSFGFEPGDGVFVPYTWPHWVETGDTPAISMAITWKTVDILATNKLYAVNAVARKYGFPQPAPGQNPVRDKIKIAAYSAARLLIDPLRRGERSRRFVRGLLFGRKANYYYGGQAG